MESNCSFLDCVSKANFFCKCENPVLGFCDEHFKIHTSSPGRHSLGEPEKSVQFESTIFGFENKSLNGAVLSHFGSEVFFFRVESVGCSIPKEYLGAFELLSKTLSRKILRIAAGNGEKLKMKFGAFVNACIQLIYNFNVEFDQLFNEIDRVFNNFYAQMSDLNIQSINNLLNEAQRFFEMTETAKKKLFFTVQISEERQKFIHPFMFQDHINMVVFEKSFMEIFSSFIPNKSKNFSSFFRNFEKDLVAQKKSLKEEYEKRLFMTLFGYLSSIQYAKVNVFSCQLTKNFEIHEKIPLQWTLTSCLFLQQCEVTLDKPIELSNSELLIPLNVGHNSYILYYSGTATPILVQTFKFTSFLIALGSYPERIFIYKKNNKKVHEYELRKSKLILNKDYDSLVRDREEITSFVYIKDSEKLLFVINQQQLFSKTLSSPHRAEVTQDLSDGKITDIAYYKEKNLILVKCDKNLKIFNTHLQIQGKIIVSGQFLATVTTLQDFGYVVLTNEDSMVEVKFQLERWENRKSVVLFGKSEIKPCELVMNNDFIQSMRSSSKYVECVTKKFPAFNVEVPEAIILQVKDKVSIDKSSFSDESLKHASVFPSKELPKAPEQLVNIRENPKQMNPQPFIPINNPPPSTNHIEKPIDFPEKPQNMTVPPNLINPIPFPPINNPAPLPKEREINVSENSPKMIGASNRKNSQQFPPISNSPSLIEEVNQPISVSENPQNLIIYPQLNLSDNSGKISVIPKIFSDKPIIISNVPEISQQKHDLMEDSPMAINNISSSEIGSNEHKLPYSQSNYDKKPNILPNSTHIPKNPFFSDPANSIDIVPPIRQLISRPSDLKVEPTNLLQIPTLSSDSSSSDSSD